MYWKMKNAGSAQMWSGFKLWENNGKDLYQKSTTVTMDYQFQDLGFVKAYFSLEFENVAELTRNTFIFRRFLSIWL